MTTRIPDHTGDLRRHLADADEADAKADRDLERVREHIHPHRDIFTGPGFQLTLYQEGGSWTQWAPREQDLVDWAIPQLGKGYDPQPWGHLVSDVVDVFQEQLAEWEAGDAASPSALDFLGGAADVVGVDTPDGKWGDRLAEQLYRYQSDGHSLEDQARYALFLLLNEED